MKNVNAVSRLAVLMAAGFCLIPFLSVSPVSAQSESEYYDLLLNKQTATHEDAIRLLARMNGYAGQAWISDEIEFLSKKDFRMEPGVEKLAGVPLTVGAASHLMLHATRLDGGVMSWLFRKTQRYSVRQAVYLGLLADDASPDDVMSGRGLLGFASKLIELAGKNEKKD